MKKLKPGNAFYSIDTLILLKPYNDMKKIYKNKNLERREMLGF